ncbi:pirin family protein [Ensifer adhaerens]|uniref:pirin family protein n=1 Tax=Ensifer adhaerens TaxID=106592 RepID=UPI000CF162D5|nr:pirin family protein [Ensifer adhaerens]
MLYRGAKSPVVRDMGGFKVRLNMPGWLLPRHRDHGYGPLAMVAETILDPGRLVAMHEHRNDEILSWVPDGVMRHDDRASGKLITDRAHLMVMNAGQSFWHSEETLPSDPPLRMLQILVRPRSLDLPANIQHGPITPVPANQWRHLVGPEDGDAPFFLRNAIDVYDLRVEAGAAVAFPKARGRHLYFYLFSGAAKVGGAGFADGDQGLLASDDQLELVAVRNALLIAFLIDPNAPVVRQGTIGDHPKIPPAYLARPLLHVLRWRNRLLGKA